MVLHHCITLWSASYCTLSPRAARQPANTLPTASDSVNGCTAAAAPSSGPSITHHRQRRFPCGPVVTALSRGVKDTPQGVSKGVLAFRQGRLAKLTAGRRKDDHTDHDEQPAEEPLSTHLSPVCQRQVSLLLPPLPLPPRLSSHLLYLRSLPRPLLTPLPIPSLPCPPAALASCTG